MSAPLTDVVTDELLEQEIPCGDCGKSAVLRSFGHGCPSRPEGMVAPFYKCIGCWQRWLHKTLRSMTRPKRLQQCPGGYLWCEQCKQRFYTVEALSDYRPF